MGWDGIVVAAAVMPCQSQAWMHEEMFILEKVIFKKGNLLLCSVTVRETVPLHIIIQHPWWRIISSLSLVQQFIGLILSFKSFFFLP